MSANLSPLVKQHPTETRECELHGSFVSTNYYGVHWTGCQTCADIAKKTRDEEAAAERRRELVQRYRNGSEIPHWFSRAGFDDTTPSELVELRRKVLAKKTSGPTIVVGPVGTGKTFSACALGNALISKCVRVIYVTAPGYGRAIRETWGRRSGESEGSILEKYSSVSFLILDELGAQRDCDAVFIQDLICSRYEAGLLHRTLVISNLAPANFAASIGERAADRLHEGATLIRMTGKSRRIPAPESKP